MPIAASTRIAMASLVNPKGVLEKTAAATGIREHAVPRTPMIRSLCPTVASTSKTHSFSPIEV